MPRRSLNELVARFDDLGPQCAYVFRNGYRTLRWSYRDIAALARRVALELQRRGIAKGDRVVLWGENRGEWVSAFWGCALRGVIVVPLDRGSSQDFAGAVAGQVSARLLVSTRGLQIAGVPQIELDSLTGSLGRLDGRLDAVEISRNDPLEIIFTSGTTAEPKGVVISHGNVLANLEPLEQEIAKYLRYERWVHPLRFLDLLPLSHVFGQFLGLFVPQSMGATVVFQESLSPSEVIRICKRERVSVLITVPRMLESLRAKLERDFEADGKPDAFRSRFIAAEGEHILRRWWKFRDVHRQFGWKFWAFICGGAALDEATETFWSRLAFAVVQGYGLTESTSLISVNHPFRTGRRSIGKLLPGREVKLAPDGEILARGENIAAGYWHGEGLTPVSGDGGWFHTGDLGALDEQGNLYFKGRKTSMIVTAAGMNVYPQDLEAALRRQTGVRDCVVLAWPSGGNAEPCAVLLLEPTADAGHIVRDANRELAEYQQMRRWFRWPDADFPRTATRKPKVAEIERRVLKQEVSSPVERSSLAELIARIHSGKTGERTAPLQEDLQLSSLDRVELMSALEDRYQVDLDEARFTQATTLSDLEKMLEGVEQRATSYSFPRWAQRWPVRLVRTAVYHLLTWPATMILAAPRVLGRENLRGVTGPLLVACNHVTEIDIGFVLAALPWRLRTRLATAMVGERLIGMRNGTWRPGTGDSSPPKAVDWSWRALDLIDYFLVVSLFNVFPLPRESGFRESFSFAGELVDRGCSVLVFPEGALTKDGALQPLRSGIGVLATHLGVPVLPVRIDGLYEARVRGRRLVGPGKIVVRLGKPVSYRPDENPNSIACDLERRMREL
jgi:long-chain acyl-CoA synthetase